MKKLLKIRLGGGRVQPGLLPLDAHELVRDLLAAMAEEGGDQDAWRRANPHIEVIGRDSTLAAVHTEEYSELVGPATVFVHKAEQKNLRRKGLELVEKRFKPGQVWTYAEVTVFNGHAPRVRFDTAYRDSLKEDRRPLIGIDELFARVVRVGGEANITAKLEIGRQSGTFKVCSTDLARKLAGRLYETAKIKAEVQWDPETLEILDLTVLDIDERWQDIHLGQLIEEHGGRLPMELAVGSTEEILHGRDRRDEE